MRPGFRKGMAPGPASSAVAAGQSPILGAPASLPAALRAATGISAPRLASLPFARSAALRLAAAQAFPADGAGAAQNVTASRTPPQWRPPTVIGAERSFISTKFPPPMSRR